MKRVRVNDRGHTRYVSVDESLLSAKELATDTLIFTFPERDEPEATTEAVTIYESKERTPMSTPVSESAIDRLYNSLTGNTSTATGSQVRETLQPADAKSTWFFEALTDAAVPSTPAAVKKRNDIIREADKRWKKKQEQGQDDTSKLFYAFTR